jgi:hypothetical protein
VQRCSLIAAHTDAHARSLRRALMTTTSPLWCWCLRSSPSAAILLPWRR